MNRRDFVKKSAISASLPFWLQSCDHLTSRSSFPVSVHSDHSAGHLIMESSQWPVSLKLETETVIVGGGLSGLAAARTIRDEDFLLFELSDRIGGTSASTDFEGISFCQGAHYDLAYPDYYGEEVLGFLEELQIIQFEPWKKMWSFKDRQHIIPSYRRQQCYAHGAIRGDVIPEGYQKETFYKILSDYLGEMKLPTRLIAEEYRYLDEISFFQFLSDKMEFDSAFERQISYHMLDDYGGTMRQVSALAGIHYFMCRPYYTASVDLFSPPNGNDYFVEKILSTLAIEKIKTNHLVKSIVKTNNGFEVEVLDVINKKLIHVSCDKLIYAGQKHALKYIFPEEASLFENSYAPWMVINMVTNTQPGNYGFWQNEYLGDREDFLGFIDSSVQSRESMDNKRVFSAYYCLKPESREHLITIPNNREFIANEALNAIEEVLNKKIDVNAAFINVMGHAMAIPKPGYLFNDANTKSSSGIVYAGVDNGRLPLLFEALDSGIAAASKY